MHENFMHKFSTSSVKHPAPADLFTLRVQPYSVRHFRELKEENCVLSSTFNCPTLSFRRNWNSLRVYLSLILHLYGVLKMLLRRYYYSPLLKK